MKPQTKLEKELYAALKKLSRAATKTLCQFDDCENCPALRRSITLAKEVIKKYETTN